MFGRKTERDTATTRSVDDRPFRARGGVSGGAVFTGVVVAIGAMAIFTVLIAAVLIGLGLQEEGISQDEAIEVGIWTGVGIVIVQFLSYLWGGYTAGRMARGSGLLNGLLVPLLTLIIAALVGVIAAQIGYSADLNLPFSTENLPLENDYVQDWGAGLGIAALVAMFLGGVVGGMAGQRWHTKLENRVYEDEVVEERTVDVRDDDDDHSTTTTPPPPPATSTTGGAYEERNTTHTTPIQR